MDAQLKAKWIEALRSGKYEQARGRLHTRDGGYCCLGVLCRVADLEIDEDTGDAVVGALESGDDYQPIYDIISKENAPPLWRRNDGLGEFEKALSFAEIADYIEENIPSDALSPQVTRHE